jgi:hypothetical protein
MGDETIAFLVWMKYKLGQTTVLRNGEASYAPTLFSNENRYKR